MARRASAASCLGGGRRTKTGLQQRELVACARYGDLGAQQGGHDGNTILRMA